MSEPEGHEASASHVLQVFTGERPMRITALLQTTAATADATMTTSLSPHSKLASVSR